MSIENVVYTVDPDGQPAIRYHAMPSLCTGGADTLSEARTSYRADLTGLLHVGRRDLPPVIEHVEAVVHGMWVRERVGAVHRDHSADRMLLQAVLAPGAAQEEMRSYIDLVTARGAEPVVLLMEPDEPVGTVLDQMTSHDAVVVAYSDPEDEVGWAAIYGPRASGANDIPQAAGGNVLRTMPIDRLTRTRGLGHAVRVTGASLPEAC